MIKKTSLTLAATIAVLVFAFTGAALAQSTPSDDAYSGVGAEQQQSAVLPSNNTGPPSNTSSPTPATPSQSAPAKASSGSLPFTGFQVGIALLAGMALVGTGLVVRRAAGHGAQA